MIPVITHKESIIFPGLERIAGACESQHTAKLFLPVSVLTPQLHALLSSLYARGDFFAGKDIQDDINILN